MNKCEQYCRTIKRMANGEAPLLPAEYQQVEYLQSYIDNYYNSATNWIHIDTGVNYFADFEIKCQNSENIGNVTCGCGDSSYGASLGRYSANQPNYTFFATTSSYYVSNIPMTTGGVFSWRGNDLYVNGEYVAQLTKPTSTKHFILYGYTGIYYKFIRIFYCKLWDNDGNLIRHYIPCYRKSDNTPGMYELVNNTFETGTGSYGYFIVGQDV